MTRALALATVIAMSGCSFALVRKPPTNEVEPRRWPRCTEHSFWPVVDGAVAALAAFGVVYFLGQDDEWAPVGALFEGGIMVGFGASAITGLGKSSECRAQRRAYEAAAAENR